MLKQEDGTMLRGYLRLLADYFEKTTRLNGDTKAASNWLREDISKIMKVNYFWLKILSLHQISFHRL